MRFLPRIAILLESADIWRVEATSEKNAIREFTRDFLFSQRRVSPCSSVVKTNILEKLAACM